MEATGDHQVQHQPVVSLHADGYAFANAAEVGYGAAFEIRG